MEWAVASQRWRDCGSMTQPLRGRRVSGARDQSMSTRRSKQPRTDGHRLINNARETGSPAASEEPITHPYKGCSDRKPACCVELQESRGGRAGAKMTVRAMQQAHQAFRTPIRTVKPDRVLSFVFARTIRCATLDIRCRSFRRLQRAASRGEGGEHAGTDNIKPSKD